MKRENVGFIVPDREAAIQHSFAEVSGMVKNQLWDLQGKYDDKGSGITIEVKILDAGLSL